MLLIGVAGLLGGYLYTGGPKGYKYLALGDVLVFVLMGPLSVVGTYLALTGEVSLLVLLASCWSPRSWLPSCRSIAIATPPPIGAPG